MQDLLFRKSLVLGIIILFVGASIAPVIGGKINALEVDEKTLNNSSTNPSQSMSLLTFHTFGETGEKQCDVNLPTEVASDIYDRLEELKYMIVYEPKSKETQALKNEFVEILAVNGLIPAGLSKDYVLSLLNPSWLNKKQITPNTRTRYSLYKSFESGISEKIFYILQNFKNCFGKTVLENTLITPPSVFVMSWFCSIASGGSGVILPLFLLPRPRAIALWSSPFAETVVGEFFAARGFVASGEQSGSMLGFMGIGLTYAFPGGTVYGFAGYTVNVMISAQQIEFYP